MQHETTGPHPQGALFPTYQLYLFPERRRPPGQRQTKQERREKRERAERKRISANRFERRALNQLDDHLAPAGA